MGRPCSVCLRPDRLVVDAALWGANRTGTSTGVPVSPWVPSPGTAPTSGWWPPRRRLSGTRCAACPTRRCWPSSRTSRSTSGTARRPTTWRTSSGAGASVKSRVRHVYAGTSGRGRHLPALAGVRAWQVRVLTEWHRTMAPDGLVIYYTKAQHDGRRLHHPMEWIARTPLIPIDRLVWTRGGTPNVDTTRLLPTSGGGPLPGSPPGGLPAQPPADRACSTCPPPTTGRRAATLPHAPGAGSGLPLPGEAAPGWPAPAGGRLYAGTGTTGLIARELGMDFLLGERSEEYVALALRNLAGPAQRGLLEEAAG